MKSYLVFGLLSLVTAVTLSGASFDRVAHHDARLSGLDLDGRAQATQPDGRQASVALSSADLAVSRSNWPARFNQDNAQVVTLADGGWLAVWDDERLGNRKVFWQRLNSSGNIVGPNVQVAGSVTGADYVEPKLAVDTLGRICLFYRDQTNGMIYGSRFTAALEVDLTPFLANDTSLNSFAGPYDVAVFPDGQMVIVWEDYSALGSTVEMRLYAPSGASLMGPTTANSDGGSAGHWVPSVAVAPGSGYLVAWEDYRNGKADIYARQFTGGGNPVGTDFALVPPPADEAAQYAPQVTYSLADKYVIGWIDTRDGQEVYLQRYDQTGGLTGGNQLVSGEDSMVINWDLDLSVSSGGEILAIWGAFGADNSILGLKLDSGLIPSGPPAVHNLSSLGRRWGPSTSHGSLDDYALVWTEFVNDDASINFMLFDSLGDRRLGRERRINDDQVGAPSTSPFVVASSDWYNLICFADRKNDAGDIFVRAVSNAGVFANIEQRINQDAGCNLQSEPSIGVSATRSLVVWNDSRTVGGTSGQRIYGRFGSLAGEFSEDEFLISDTTSSAVKASPRVAFDRDGQGMAVWIDRRDGTAQVWGRWLAADGSLDGDELPISQSVSDSSATALHIGMDTAGHFYVVWLDIGMGQSTVKGRLYNPDKSQGDSLSWASSLPGVAADELAADVGPDGIVSLFWTGAVGGRRNGYLAQLTSNGSVVTGAFVIMEDTAADVSEPSISVSDNGYISVAWVDRRDGRPVVYHQVFTSSLSPIGSNQPVSTATPEFMTAPSTHASRGRAWYAWADPRENGLNVYATDVLYLPTDVTDDDNSLLPGRYQLAQNYPNPFNPATIIPFTLPVQSRVRLTVFNLLGREVRTLADDVCSAGQHHVAWDGTDASGKEVASGVYLYKLTAGDFTESRKMVLLK